MTRVISQGNLTRSFRTPRITQEEQEQMRERLAWEFVAMSDEVPELDRLLTSHGGSPKAQRRFVRDAIELLAKAYSSCSSVYPEDWFAKYYQHMKHVNKEAPPEGELVFIAPPTLDTKGVAA